MIMAMAGGEEISSVATNALRVWCNRNRQRSVGWVLELRWCGVTVTAFAGVHSHWVAGRMTADAERGVEDVA